MRIDINDRYNRGPAIFERKDDGVAILTIQGNIPINAKYFLDGENWRVISISPSNYVDSINNIRLERI